MMAVRVMPSCMSAVTPMRGSSIVPITISNFGRMRCRCAVTASEAKGTLTLHGVRVGAEQAAVDL